MVKIAPQTALEFYFYEFFKQHLMEEGSNNKLHKMFCGNMTGFAVGFLIHPLELIRTHLSVSVKNVETSTLRKPTILSTAADLYWTGGIPGLYRGLVSSQLSIMPFIGFKMASFDILKTLIHLDRSDPYYVIKNMALGSTAGTIAVSIAYPLDTVRRRMMLRGTKGYENYSSMFDCIKKVYQREGTVGFYKGYVPSIVKMVPA